MQDSTATQAQQKMQLAEALTDASRTLDRARRRLELVIMALQALRNLPTTEEHIARCRAGVAELETLNRAVRSMNT